MKTFLSVFCLLLIFGFSTDNGPQTSQQSKTDRLETICSLISAEQGVSIVPKLALESINHNLRVIDIDHSNHAHRNVQLLYRSRSIRKICSDKIASLVKSAMNHKSSQTLVL